MDPNAIATMKAFVEKAGKSTYRSVEGTGRKTLKNINAMASADNLTGAKPSTEVVPVSSTAAVAVDDTTGKGSKGGILSKMVCYSLQPLCELTSKMVVWIVPFQL